jgi:hypothetical protein
MKELSPYWFILPPYDVEHKYYVLMDFLQSIKNDLQSRKYTKQVKKITSVYKDLENFKQNSNLSFLVSCSLFKKCTINNQIFNFILESYFTTNYNFNKVLNFVKVFFHSPLVNFKFTISPSIFLN